MQAYAHAPYNSKSGPFEWLGYSIEFLVARNTDGDEVSVKFSLHPESQSAKNNSAARWVIYDETYDETYDEIMMKLGWKLLQNV